MNGLPLFSSTPLCGTSLTTPTIVGQSSGLAGRPPEGNAPPDGGRVGKDLPREALVDDELAPIGRHVRFVVAASFHQFQPQRLEIPRRPITRNAPGCGAPGGSVSFSRVKALIGSPPWNGVENESATEVTPGISRMA